MFPSQVRARVLEGHGVLLAQVDRVSALAGSGSQRLGPALEELLALLDAQIALEEAILWPTLRDTDAFGDVRCRQLGQHHAAQRSGVEACLQRIAARSRGIGPSVRRRMDALRADIDEEERSLLDPFVLRDDTITISPTA